MSAHTPAPWLVMDRTVYALNDRGFNRFCAQVQDAHTDVGELEDNARLIAAAPEMLQALKQIVLTAQNYRENRYSMPYPGSADYYSGVEAGAEAAADIAQEAIARAEGRT